MAAVCPRPIRRSRASPNGRSRARSPTSPSLSTAPKGAPNVLLVLDRRRRLRQSRRPLAGPCQTPNLTRLADAGLRYNRFHVTALCSPTRAALLTGRNHHAVGFGSIAEFAGGWPGYNATWPKSAAGDRPDPPGQRLRHRRVRQVAPHARRPAGRRRPVRPLADRPRASTTSAASSAAHPASTTRF